VEHDRFGAAPFMSLHSHGSPRSSRLIVLYAITIFLSAFLLFQVQPLISRFISPGSAAVRRLDYLLLFSKRFCLPAMLTPTPASTISAQSADDRPFDADRGRAADVAITPSTAGNRRRRYPTARILVLLAVCIGLPYFVLASTGHCPGLFSRAFPGRRLTALLAVEYRSLWRCSAIRFR